jgi:dihydrolipoamide dehydrogenase
MKEYDVIVIGAGPGGYVCAIRAAQLGFKVACVEKDPTLGGTCLNVGCIPSKALLTASHKYASTKHHLGEFGVEVSGVKLNLKKMMQHKNNVIDANTKGIEFLFRKNKVDWIKGLASFVDQKTIAVAGESYTAKHIIIATGSSVMDLPNVAIDEKMIVSSTGALEFSEVPKELAVIGGGVIGLEMAAVWSALGAKVTIIEYLDRILPPMDEDISKEMQKIMVRDGLTFMLSTKVTSAEIKGKKVTLSIEDAKGGNIRTQSFDKVLVAIGRKANTTGLALDKAGVALDDRGRVITDAHFKTNVNGIYAIGDVREGAMLAHKAEEEGVVLAEQLTGQKPHLDYNLIPNVVYTHPEIASVGQNERELKAAGIDYKIGKFPFMANGRARAMNEMDGYVKILADAKTDRVLGAHIIGADAGTLIGEVVMAMEFGASSEDIARTCHAHPTLQEVIKEAALAVDKRAIHN